MVETRSSRKRPQSTRKKPVKELLEFRWKGSAEKRDGAGTNEV